jgi:hypothetical protein
MMMYYQGAIAFGGNHSGTGETPLSLQIVMERVSRTPFAARGEEEQMFPGVIVSPTDFTGRQYIPDLLQR